MNELPERKEPRLNGYDYSRAGCYFVTFCVQDRHEMLGRIVGGGFHAAPQKECPITPKIILSDMGQEVEKCIAYINGHSQGTAIVKHVVMPNHIHLIVCLTGGHGNPPLPDVVGQLKSFTTKKWNEFCGTKIQKFWQRSYHDHIIRNEDEYRRIWQYIDENPANWDGDEYYVP